MHTYMLNFPTESDCCASWPEYLFVHEPCTFTLDKARSAVDEVSGCGVTTFAYGVNRGDGLFYPSDVGKYFGQGAEQFDQANYWRAKRNMETLIEAGHDPLQVLIDRAHHHSMEFVASLRMGGFDGLLPATPQSEIGQTPPMGPSSLATSAEGGTGLMDPRARSHQLQILTELVSKYNSDGLELDFACAPSGGPAVFRQQDAAEGGPVLTEMLRQIRRIDCARPGGFLVGARIYPTLAMNLENGLEIDVWLEEGLVDYVIPMLYFYMSIDTQATEMEWIVRRAHLHGVAVYAMLQPYYADTAHMISRTRPNPIATSSAMRSAAAAAAYAKGADGVCAWMLPWPLGAEERESLRTLADREALGIADKHYFARWHVTELGLVRSNMGTEYTQENIAWDQRIPSPLPVTLLVGSASASATVDIFVADDPADTRIASIRLCLGLHGVTAHDSITLSLNRGADAGGEELGQLNHEDSPWTREPYPDTDHCEPCIHSPLIRAYMHVCVMYVHVRTSMGVAPTSAS